MQKLLKNLADFFVEYYSGTIQWKVGKWYCSGVKLGFAIFIVVWMLTKGYQLWKYDDIWWWWVDTFMVIIGIPQYLAGFSMFWVKIKRKYEK